jgi:hypothetical protein
MRFSNFAFVLVILLSTGSLPAAAQTAATSPQSVAFLGLRLENDNEALEPTTAAERSRVDQIAAAFKACLDASGRYKVLLPSAEVASQIAAGQDPGSCHGCEIAYGKQIGGDLVAWMTVQKVSNLILNMNLYMGDVASNRMTFVHSVDIRGNTDESWMRSLNYLLDNYFFAAAGRAAATQ